MVSASVARAESQNNDYKGITDPFGDPANYEFAEDEKEDKEFFHLGRFLMLGVDIGAALFTGGLGTSTEPGPYVGGRLVYFFDRSIALEAAGHFSNHLDSVRPASGGFVDIDTTMIPINVGFRYYFDTRDAPKAIAVANPYLSFGGGVYIRSQSVIAQSSGITGDADGMTSNFGAYGGAGIEFSIYRRHIYLGIDVRYHMVFFSDEGSDWDGLLEVGERGGDYVTPMVTLTYNF